MPSCSLEAFVETLSDDVDGDFSPYMCFSVPLATAGVLQQRVQVGFSRTVTTTSTMGILHHSQVSRGNHMEFCIIARSVGGRSREAGQWGEGSSDASSVKGGWY